MQKKLFFLVFFFLSIPIFSEGKISSQPVSKIDIEIKIPPERMIEPNSFPAFVFPIYNNSDKSYDLDFEFLIPENWKIFSQKVPSQIEPQGKEKVRLTVVVPKEARADTIHQIVLILEHDKFSATAKAKIKIKAKPSFKVVSLLDEKKIIPGKTENLDFLIMNNGNVLDTLVINTEIPPEWDLLKSIDKLILKPQQKRNISLTFKTPKKIKPETEETIRLSVISTASQKNGLELSRTIDTKITFIGQFDKKISTSLYPAVPVNVGFALDNIKKGNYPSLTFFTNTGYINLGKYKTRIETKQRTESVPTEQKPKLFTDYFRYELAGKNWNVKLGDVNTTSNPLISDSFFLPGLQQHIETARGFSSKYSIEKAYLSFLYGKNLSENYNIYSVVADYQVTEQFEISSVLLGKNDSHLLKSGTVVESKNNFSLGTSFGISKSYLEEKKISGATEFLANKKLTSLELASRIFWAGKSYTGNEKGKTGAFLSSRWRPKPFIYCWNNLLAYNQYLAETDSSAFITDFDSRFLFTFRGYPSLNIGMNIFREKILEGLEKKTNKFDLRIQKQLKYGLPSVYFIFTNNSEPLLGKKNIYEICLDWISYIKFIKYKIEQKFSRSEQSPLNYKTGLDINTRLYKVIFGLYFSREKNWEELENQDYISQISTDIGISSNFNVKLFGLDYNLKLELGRNFEEEENWRISLFLSAGGLTTFYMPFPFVKTKGRIYGQLYLDKNGNGIRDLNEIGEPNILLFLDDEQAITDSDGKFEFPSMAAGEYPFLLDIAALPAYLKPANEIPETIFIDKGEEISLDIPITSICSISGYVYLDSNENSKFDANEKSVSTMRLEVQNQDQQKWEAYSNNDGYFEIADLLPGIYYLKIDRKWLPRRKLPAKEEWSVILTQKAPHQKINIAIREKKLQIKKTFKADKN